MPRIAGKATVDRILKYLDQQISSSSTAADREQRCAAWVLLFKFFYQPEKPAFSRVLEMYGIIPIPGKSCATQLWFGLHEQTEIDGRKGREWIASVLRYLEFRRDIVAINFVNCQLPKYFPVGPSLLGCVTEGQRHIIDYMKIKRRARRRKPRIVPKKSPQKVIAAKTAVA